MPCSRGILINACRMRRLARFLRTAFPTLRRTTRPTLVWAPIPGEAATVTAPRRLRVPWERTRRKSVARRSDATSRGEALASFPAAGTEDSPAGTRLHAVPESMSALPAAHLGLIRSFHDKLG